MTKEEWDLKQNSIKKSFNYIPTGTPGQVKKVEATEETNVDQNGDPIDSATAKREWNKFRAWMDSKGYTGKAELDKGDYGNKLFRQWQKETKSPLTEEYIPTLRENIVSSIADQKERILKSTGLIKVPLPGTGELVYGEKARPVTDRIGYKMLENEKSANPNYIGSLFSTWKFPEYEIHETTKSDPFKSKTAAELEADVDTTKPKITKKLL
jgi:hypothetical protein